jgi:hypothetical protein
MTDIETLEEQRKQLNINKTTMSELVGYKSKDAWGRTVKRGSAPQDVIERAKWVLHYTENNGIVPDPRKVPV